MSPNSTLVQRLREMGIHNGHDLAKHVEAPAVIYFLLTSKEASYHPRVRLHWGDGQNRYFEPAEASRGKLSTIRKDCIAQAIEYAAEHLGEPHWRRSVFQHCWLPSASIDKIQAELAAQDALKAARV